MKERLIKMMNEIKEMANGYYFVYLVWWYIITILAAWMYYRSVIAGILSFPISLYLLKLKTVKDRARKKQELVYQFRDLLQTVSASLMAGRNVEGAFLNASKEMSMIWGGKETVIYEALASLESRMNMNVALEECIRKMAEELDCQEAYQFAEMFEICKRNGANIINAIKVCEQTLSDKLTVMREIEAVISQRRLELKILLYFPHFMFLFLLLSTDNYVLPLYTDLFGRVIVTSVLLLIMFAGVLGRRITSYDA